MIFACYADQVTGNISDIMINYYCEFNDVVTLVVTIFLFVLLIAIWKKILWK